MAQPATARTPAFDVALLPRAAYEAAYVAGSDVIGFAFETQAGEHAFASDRRTSFRARPNSLSFIPAGCGVYSRSATGGEYLLVRRTTGEALGRRRFNDAIVPRAIAAACRLRELLLRGGASQVDLEEHLLVLSEVVQGVLAEGTRATRAAAWMTQRRLRNVDDLIDAEMTGDLTVGSLAGALGLSTGFFIRAFRAGTGRTPHDYVMDRRVARARMLVQSTDLTLSSIAAACGFSSHSHMSTAFRRRLGVRPTAFRTT